MLGGQTEHIQKCTCILIEKRKTGNSAIMAITCMMRIDAYKYVNRLHTFVLMSGLRVLCHFQLYFSCFFNHGGHAVLLV